MHLYLLVLSFLCLCASLQAAKETKSSASGIKKKSVSNHEQTATESIGSFLDLLPEMMPEVSEIIQQGQIQVLSFAESMLEKSTDLVDDFYDVSDRFQNATMKRSDAKVRLRYIKQKARHMREDIEDEIEVQREKAAKVKAAEKRVAEEKIAKLTTASQKLRSIIKRSSFPRKHFAAKSAKNGKADKHGQSVGTTKKRNKATTSRPSKETDFPKSTQISNTKKPKNTTDIPSVEFGLGDGFGKHI